MAHRYSFVSMCPNILYDRVSFYLRVCPGTLNSHCCLRKAGTLGMKNILIFSVLIISSKGFCTLQEPPYVFDSQKLEAADDSFHFLRSFVDYFYLTFKENPQEFLSIQTLTSTSGWCVGDAHPENFGFLIQDDGSTLFTMNDLDDSGPCPLGVDLFRFLVSSKLYNQNIDTHAVLDAYVSGLKKMTTIPSPAFLDLQEKSIKKGKQVDRDKISGTQIIRDSKSVELSKVQFDLLTSFILDQLKAEFPKNAKVIDAISTSKIGGGSGGMLRYEILVDTSGDLLHLELKEETRPAIYPIATDPIPETFDRLKESLKVIFGKKRSVFYKPLNFQNRTFLLRPRFSGNRGVKLDKNSFEDNRDFILVEANTLGRIHAESENTKEWIQKIEGINIQDLEFDVKTMLDFLERKFRDLKDKSLKK